MNSPYSGSARQVLDMDTIIITVDGDTYLVPVESAEYAIDEDTHVSLLKKYDGRLVAGGILFPAQTGRTMYAYARHRRYRMAMSEFRQVCLAPGYQAPLTFCVPDGGRV